MLIISIFYPKNTYAGAFSFSDMFASTVQAEDIASDNSQTIPLLQPAIHSDPNPTKGGSLITIVDASALQTEMGPSGTIHEIEEKPQSDKISIYTVHEGDSLSSIASMFGVSVNTIIWANNLKGSKDIHKDDQLIILPMSGVKHTVAKGETLKSISAKYKSDIEEIKQFNDIGDGGSLALGQEILIPDGELSVSSSKSSVTPKSSAPSSQKSLAGYFMRPISGGVRTQGLHGGCNCGVDIASKLGTPVYAAASGTVILSREGAWNGGYGNYVVISHQNGTQTLYAHLQKNSVSFGDIVAKGDQIGLMGSTGRSTGTHLHFEVRGGKNPF